MMVKVKAAGLGCGGGRRVVMCVAVVGGTGLCRCCGMGGSCWPWEEEVVTAKCCRGLRRSKPGSAMVLDMGGKGA